MNYSAIINRSFEIAWKYKSLWIFGLFAGGSSGFNINENFGARNKDFDFSGMSGAGGFDPEMFGQIISNLVGPILIFGLVLLVLSLICKPALIDAANKISRGGKYSFGDAFSVGVDNFFKFFGLMLIGMFVGGVGMAVLVGIVVVGFVVNVALGVVTILICLPVFLIFIWLLATTLRLAECAIVVRKVSIGDGLAEGWSLFKNNLKDSIIIALIYIGFVIAFFILMAIVWAIFGIPIAALVIGSNMSVITGIIVGALIGLPVSIILGGLIGTFQTNLYTMFYFELLEPGGRHTQPIGATPAPTI